MKKIITNAGIALSSVVLLACGEDETGSSYQQQYMSIGTLTINSNSQLKVNSVEYDSSSAAIILEGQNSRNSALRTGMIATISGRVNDTGTRGLAEDVVISSEIAGVLWQITNEGTLIIDNITVHLRAETQYGIGLSENSFTPGNSYQVDGFFDQNNELHASFVKLVDGTVLTEKLSGIITNLNENLKVFTLANSTISYTSLAHLYTLENGQFAEVIGRNNGSDNKLVASHIKLDSSSLTPGTIYDVQGFITQTNSNSNFLVNGFNVSLNDNSVVYASTINNLVPGVLVNMTFQPSADGSALVISAVQRDTFTDQSDNGNSNTDTQSDSNTSGESNADSNLQNDPITSSDSNTETNTERNTQGNQ